MENKIDKIKAILQKNDYRVTEGRKEIIKVFVNSNRHLSPLEVYELVKDKNISLPTVYRTIDILKSNGIIKEVSFNNERYFELKLFSQKCMHIHFRCQKCGKIIDIYDTNIILKLIEIRNELEKQYDFLIEDVSATLCGLCSECRKG
ncbi:Fur family transcriptional regulator [Caminicella sporogenes]|uniref:Fur family transcriptional regulator n=1 Tax=Caminicella sporogenes TaxID=166485 RepID=UPI00135663DA|nr:Fur family transcriptional regulator [Caminicella sporogenes]WIF94200.1 Fur family transcriptional regulator [Caminicella sporogenes]